VLCLHRIWGTTDSPNPVDWSRQPEAIWFELYQSRVLHRCFTSPVILHMKQVYPCWQLSSRSNA
jgi:hypothetical protein